MPDAPTRWQALADRLHDGGDRCRYNVDVVSLFAFVLGALYGLGTLYIMALNGLMPGGIFAFTGQYGTVTKTTNLYSSRVGSVFGVRESGCSARRKGAAL